jgi:DNA-directed RNA polymerase subunit M/transcription elongation factor TFIIS
MDKNKLLSPKEIEATAVCHSCGSSFVLVRETVAVSSVKDASDTSWNVEGAITLTHCIHGACINCGKVFEIVRRDIPIRYSSYTCPKCESSAYMMLRIKEGSYSNETFQFIGILECKECGNQLSTKFRKAIKKLWQVTKIKISLTGIEVEKDKD